MNVVYASNDNYARHLGVSMCSLFDNNSRERTIDVYILSVGLCEENRKKLNTIGRRYGRKIHYIEVDGLRERIPFPVDTGRFDISTLGRLFIGEMLPDEVKRILYLDCDTVIIRSVKNLWGMDLEESIIGAVQEPTIYTEVKEDIGLRAGDPYFNAGVLLVNLEKWRREDMGRKLMAYYEERDGKLFANDQDAINHVLKGRIKSIMPSYNFFPNYRYFRYKELVRQSEAYLTVSEGDLHRAKHHPVIIHYMGDERPWKAGNFNHYRRAYEIYLKKTPWNGMPKEKGQEAYMAAYHAMDYATFLCPAVRRMISRKYMERAKKNGKGI
ncbi:glycosyltransferase family 8 protein [Clostridium sp. AM58-1XD]|uniref:glycosyltransferase family 8 protein n=1 Tax=Clostridium sp. AM58-1XD TaxID=2292307 RepID=UPI000E5556A3|nr:glycosyltransferase family 8 protein [Clostridium sp. AM58-1XD]RGY98935.1 glycosyltransferase family 8 protein [Clostridium sp. AM58-1XD]